MAYDEEIRAQAGALYKAHPDWTHEKIAEELGKLFPEARRIPDQRTVGYWVSGKKGTSRSVKAVAGLTGGNLRAVEEQRAQLLDLVLEGSFIEPEQVHLTSSELLDELKKGSRSSQLEEPEDWWYTG